MSVSLISTRDMTREAWLDWRRKGIGGSDVPKILGFSKYGTALTVWLEKTGQLEPEEAGEAAYWGNVMEPVLAQEFQTRTGLRVRRRNAILQHPQYPWMLANIDRELVGAREGLEIKTASEYLRDDWDGDEIPDAYYLQCQHYMAVTGYERWWIAVLIGGSKFRHKCIERNQKTIDLLIEQEQRFWWHVTEGVAPAIDGSQAASVYLKETYPHSNGEVVNLPQPTLELLEEYDAIKEEEKALDARKSSVENRIKALLGDYETGMVGSRKATWKTVETSRLDTKALQATHPAIYAEFCKTSFSRRFSVK